MNLDDENIRRWIEDGDRVKSEYSRTMRGTAFTKNKIGQWLVRWDTGLWDIVHENNIERDV
jgi:translation initiation factor IF-3